MRNVKIYTLACPDTGEIRYIGKTINKLSTRLKIHCKEPIKSDKRWNWMQTLSENPIIELLDEIPENKWSPEIEISYMWLFKSWGFNLTNTIWDIQYNQATSKTVYQYDLKGNYLKTYQSGAFTKVPGVYRAIKNSGIAGNYRWSYDKVDKLLYSNLRYTILYAYDYSGDYKGWCCTSWASKTEAKGMLGNARSTDKRNKNRVGYKGYRWFKEYIGISIKVNYPKVSHKPTHSLTFKLRYSLD